MKFFGFCMQPQAELATAMEEYHSLPYVDFLKKNGPNRFCPLADKLVAFVLHGIAQVGEGEVRIYIYIYVCVCVRLYCCSSVFCVCVHVCRVVVPVSVCVSEKISPLDTTSPLSSHLGSCLCSLCGLVLLELNPYCRRSGAHHAIRTCNRTFWPDTVHFPDVRFVRISAGVRSVGGWFTHLSLQSHALHTYTHTHIHTYTHTHTHTSVHKHTCVYPLSLCSPNTPSRVLLLSFSQSVRSQGWLLCTSQTRA
jgi:hypothetical protein